ncbi:hypothetical protein TWF102_005316 [Orbilia oligospora]|uniref:Uncharacterized protein n=1 Tax=Orbilia oligospora TaxID=2813651 RepID=A0A7C8JLH4_ORBOL|nr:hypothetical protein TWF102_005316 [Orbilia oligospora]KAF3239445.1 hypothetical protein TWF128_011778 [Orbilia oligospora]
MGSILSQDEAVPVMHPEYNSIEFSSAVSRTAICQSKTSPDPPDSSQVIQTAFEIQTQAARSHGRVPHIS